MRTRAGFRCPDCGAYNEVKNIALIHCEQCGFGGPGGEKRSKFRNIKVGVDGHIFDSKGEAKRYTELRLRERAGDIRDLQIQPEYQIDLGGKKPRKYRADFSYIDCKTGELVVEDFKSPVTITPIYRLKRDAMLKQHGIKIVEVTR